MFWGERKSKFFGAIVCAIIAPLSFHGKTLKIDEQKVIELALSRNFTLRIERFSPQIAEEGIRLQKGVFDPVLGFNLTQSTDENDPLNSNTSGVSKIETDTLDGSIGGSLSTGTSYSLGLNSQNRRGTFNQFVDDYTSFAGLSVRQPLLQNFGLGVNRAQIRIAQRGYEISRWEFKQVVMDVITDAIFAYNDFCIAAQNLLVAQRNRDQARQLLDETTKRVEIGAVAAVETVSAEAQLALREEAVLVAEVTKISRENTLKSLISDDLSSVLSLELESVDLVEADSQLSGINFDLDQTLEQRPDFQSALLELERHRIRLQRDKNLSLPSLDFVGSYGLTGEAGTLNSSLDTLVENGKEAYSMGLEFGYALPNRSARAQRAISRLNKNRAEIELDKLKQLIALDLDTAVRRIAFNKDRLKTSRQGRVLFEKSLIAERKKLEVGTSTTFVVLRMQSDLAQAETREIRAVAEYNNAIAEYNRITGKTLIKYNTVLP